MCRICKKFTEKEKSSSNRLDSDSWFSIYEHYMEVIDDRVDGNVITFKIKYCPMCGKNLGNGA